MENLKFGNLWGRIESASVWSDIQLLLEWSIVNVLKYKEKNLNFFLITLFLKTQILEYVKGNKLQCISTSNNIWKATLIFFCIFTFQSLERNLFYLRHRSIFLQKYKHETFTYNMILFFKINIYLSIVSLSVIENYLYQAYQPNLV